ncbi:carbonate dehydratase [Coraliomargarita parva]|uniref:carbonate dehydratase n=1 Tax=Coraliomargarita parva TaxID=3014050 RepID=UPI0022B3D16E|nr:carbonate dehydratase [Coraliomargarita parva]
MKTLPEIFENNRKWANEIRAEDPDFFEKLAKQQNPQFMWIGCSDSRVPANQIAGLMPGEVFVHRNIANMVVHTDLNMLSVLQYAVDVLEVKHVMVVGHYGCGGIKAAMGKQRFGLIDNWLRHIQDVATLQAAELEPLDEEARFDRLCELNVIAQAENLQRTSVLLEAWARGQEIHIHSWIYSLKDGGLRNLSDAITGPKE